MAGGVAGIVEALRIAAIGDGAVEAFAVVAALATLGAIAVAAVVRLGLAAAMRIAGITRWSADLTAGGERRVVAAWRAVLAACAVVGFGAVSFVLIARAHEAFRFNDGGPVGFLLACVIAPLAVAIAVVVAMLDRRTVPWLRRHGELLAGRRGVVAVGIAAAALAFGPKLLINRAVPAANDANALVVAVLVISVIAARVVRLGARRRAQVGALVVLVAAIGGTALIGRMEGARSLVVVHGTLGKRVAQGLWALADRDGDRYAAAWAGGADCDDADAARSPGKLEVAGNGIDENCTGADADVAGLAERLANRPASVPELAGPGAARPNVIVISVDALRADHLGAWGYERRTSPAIDAFSTRAVRFAWTLTPSPSTRHAIPSMFTGRYPSTIDRAAPPPSLAEVLREAGYETAAVLCCQRLTAPRELRGFSSVGTTADASRMSRAGQANADTLADEAIGWLERATAAPRDRPFFLWVHFYDPHHPYAAIDGAPDFGDTDVDRYDAEIAFADRGIGRVLAAIDKLAAPTIVAITADHGEEFAEHGLRFHARSLYSQVTRVPLLVRAPDSRPSVVEQPVSLVDLVPTLLDLAGIDGPAGMNGRSLAGAIRGTGPAPDRPLLLELVPDRQIERDLVAVIAHGWKAIWDREANAWSLYALTDPEDSRDRAADEPTRLAEYQRLLRELLDRELASHSSVPGTPRP